MAMNISREKWKDGNNVIHALCCQTDRGSWHAICDFEIWQSPSDYVPLMPNADQVDDDALTTCLGCLAEEDNEEPHAHRHR